MYNHSIYQIHPQRTFDIIKYNVELLEIRDPKTKTFGTAELSTFGRINPLKTFLITSNEIVCITETNRTICNPPSSLKVPPSLAMFTQFTQWDTVIVLPLVFRLDSRRNTHRDVVEHVRVHRARNPSSGLKLACVTGLAGVKGEPCNRGGLAAVPKNNMHDHTMWMNSNKSPYMSQVTIVNYTCVYKIQHYTFIIYVI